MAADRAIFTTIVVANPPAALLDDLELEQAKVHDAQQEHKFKVSAARANGKSTRINGPPDTTKFWFVNALVHVCNLMDNSEADAIMESLFHEPDKKLFSDLIFKVRRTKTCIEAWRKTTPSTILGEVFDEI